MTAIGSSTSGCDLDSICIDERCLCSGGGGDGEVTYLHFSMHECSGLMYGNSNQVDDPVAFYNSGGNVLGVFSFYDSNDAPLCQMISPATLMQRKADNKPSLILHVVSFHLPEPYNNFTYEDVEFIYEDSHKRFEKECAR